MNYLTRKTAPFFLMLFLTGLAGAQEYHRVEPSQTLYSIARLYQITLADLMAWNNLKDARIRPGQTLIVKPLINLNLAVGDTYQVKEGDTLESIARKFSLSPVDLKAFNSLDSEVLRTGQRLAVRKPKIVDIYTVQAGDTLLGLSGRYGLSVEELKLINQLEEEGLMIGQNLRVTRPSALPLTHKVESMDSLAGLAVLYGVDQEQIVRLNGLSGSTIYPGQTLKLQEFASAEVRTTLPAVRTPPQTEAPRNPEAEALPAPAPLTHKVEAGQTLYSLSRRYGVKVEDLVKWNSLPGTGLRTGQVLKLTDPAKTAAAAPTGVSPLPTPVQTQAQTSVQTTPTEGQNTVTAAVPLRATPQNLTWEPFVVLDKDIPLFEWNNDFYYWAHPGQTTQPNRGYYENQWTSPLKSYQKARSLWEGFEALLAKRPIKSQVLQGVTVVLDPGHGGLDPGAIVKSTDGMGDTLFVTEDEYVYDIALRMVPLLREHGAQVQLTLLSPNHLIRDTTPATRTLIHEKNEVYNSLEKNRGNGVEDWPVGGARGLERRVEVAQELFARHGGDKLFISIHADNSPGSSKAAGVFFQESGNSRDEASARFAKTLAESLGTGSYIKSRDLGVLRNNEAHRKVLVEIRNVAFQEHAWALRFANTRQMDALNLVNGILEYYKTKN